MSKMSTTQMPPALREAAEHVIYDGCPFDNAAEALAWNHDKPLSAAVEALSAAISDIAPEWFEVDDAVSAARVQAVPGAGGTIRKAVYEPNGAAGAAAYGWGDTDEDALKSLRRCLEFNLRHNGRLV